MKQDDALKIVKVEKENDDTTSIYFSGPDMERFKNRKPGQYASIRIFQDGAWSAPHPFTLSSAPGDATLRMTIKKSGAFTSSIPAIEPGTPIQCTGPYGQFCKDIGTSKEVVMIAGGVGITPFLSVLRHFKDTGADNEITLFWANKTPQDAFATKELEELTRSLKLHVVHAFSRVAPEDQAAAPAFDDGRPGKISHEYGRLNKEMFLRHIASADASFYLCGPPPMQQAVLEELSSYGVDPGRVDKEAFVFSNPKSA
ncbi:MAG: FAD/NAD-binding family oxidoreductase [Desulfovibrionales bacterium GWA2_65_9]|nr:MAG: FAD/NAD-binding family oxidoreductase [Desulfovibrionales bacterium GWA2_65_9]